MLESGCLDDTSSAFNILKHRIIYNSTACNPVSNKDKPHESLRMMQNRRISIVVTKGSADDQGSC